MSTEEQRNSPTAVDEEFDYGEEFFTGKSSDDGDISVPVEVNQNSSNAKQIEKNDIIEREENDNVSALQQQQNSDDNNEIDDWDNLEIDPQQGATLSTTTSDLINFNDALQHFDTINLQDYETQIKPNIKRSGLSAVFHSIVGPGKLHKSLASERNLIFTLALVPFDNEDVIHNRILQTIFKTLTRRKIDCARFGPHWELIGFQGNDPSTDLRGCGMLGLLTTLHFAVSLETKSLSANIYHLSRDDIQNFPFCVMSINVTRICLQIMRQGKMNKECNHRMKHRSQKYKNQFDNLVFDVFHDLYQAIYNKIYSVWKNGGKTMTESGFVLRDIETLAKNKPLDLIKEYKIQNTKKQLSGSSISKAKKSREEEEKIESFVGIEDL